MMNMLISEEEPYEEEYEQEKPHKSLQPTQKHNVVSLQSVQKSSKVVLVEPRVYAEAQDIADQLKNEKQLS